jgi:glutathione synthase
MTQTALWVEDGVTWAQMRQIRLRDDPNHWFEIQGTEQRRVDSLDVVLMRKDPPFDMDYIYTTYLLELAEANGTLVVNKPQSLRDANEKLFTAWFADCCPATLVSSKGEMVRDFIGQHGDIILKPLEGMGGQSVFRLRHDDPNISVVLENITQGYKRLVMAQRFIPEIHQGDKRILMIDGEPVPYALARIPAEGETRGNLAAGARGVSQPLCDQDLRICRRVGPTLRDKGLLFVGLDVIGDYLTEINVTSPTCIRELDRDNKLDIGSDVMAAIEARLGGAVASRSGN